VRGLGGEGNADRVNLLVKENWIRRNCSTCFQITQKSSASDWILTPESALSHEQHSIDVYHSRLCPDVGVPDLGESDSRSHTEYPKAFSTRPFSTSFSVIWASMSDSSSPTESSDSNVLGRVLFVLWSALSLERCWCGEDLVRLWCRACFGDAAIQFSILKRRPLLSGDPPFMGYNYGACDGVVSVWLRVWRGDRGS
jgi:hypothetical protein